jgi:hypothetical protein
MQHTVTKAKKHNLEGDIINILFIRADISLGREALW